MYFAAEAFDSEKNRQRPKPKYHIEVPIRSAPIPLLYRSFKGIYTLGF